MNCLDLTTDFNMNEGPLATRSLTSEVIDRLRRELEESRQQIALLTMKEKQMKSRLAEQAKKMLERGSVFENLSLEENRPTALIRRYGNLYSQSRVDTLDTLDCLAEFHGAEELKSKLVFSIVALAFRATGKKHDKIMSKIRDALQIRDNSSASAEELEKCICFYLRNSIDAFDLSDCETEVRDQIYATLYDFPQLQKCDEFLSYIKECVRVAWGLTNQNPCYTIDFETPEYCKDFHVRFHTSNQQSTEVKYYMWPTLLEGNNGSCAYKGVIVT